MVLSMSQFTQDPAYAPFLGAAVGLDAAGSNISVLSMLARLGVDPWTEAANLAQMQSAPAHQRFAGLLTRFTDVPDLVPERGQIAADLLALLPHHAPTAGPARQGGAAPIRLPPVGAPLMWMIGAVAVLGWIALLAQGH